MIEIPKILEKIFLELRSIGALPILVGGCVRDSFLKLSVKDYDIEIFNIDSFETIEESLKKFGSVKVVGKSFGVLTLSVEENDLKYDFDFALARVEKKVGLGHKGFEVITNSKLSFKEASLRRDFTINSIGYDYFKKEYLDPNNGVKDLENRILRHINDETFIEDPLRVFRAIQFSSRFNLKLDLKTFELCKRMVKGNQLEELAKQRIFEELKKLFLKSQKPSVGFSLLIDLEILKHYFKLKSNICSNTLKSLDEMVKYKVKDDFKDLYLFYALLCVDLGSELTIEFLAKITNEKKFIQKIIPLVKNHLAIFDLEKKDSIEEDLKRLSLKCDIEDLCIVSLCTCVTKNKLEEEKSKKYIFQILEKAKKMNILNRPLCSFVHGKDLIALGMKPSKDFNEILAFALDLQIEKNLSKEEILVKLKEIQRVKTKNSMGK